MISFVVFHFIFNRFKYSNNTIIRLLQKFVLYTICFYLSLYFLISIDLFGEINCDSDDEDEDEDKDKNKNTTNKGKPNKGVVESIVDGVV